MEGISHKCFYQEFFYLLINSKKCLFYLSFCRNNLFLIFKAKVYKKKTFSMGIFILKSFWNIIFNLSVISTTFWLICPLSFFRCLSNLGTYTELQTMSFIESTGVTCSDSISHNWYKC